MVIQLLFNGLLDGVFIALIALGFSLVYSATQFFVFTYGASFAWAAYTFWCLAPRLGIIGAGALAVTVAAVLGAFVDKLVFARLRTKGSPPAIAMMASIGLYVVLQNLLSLRFGDTTRAIRGPAIPVVVELFGARVSFLRVASAIAAAVAIGVVALLLKRSPYGLQLRAIADDPELAASAGLPRERTIAGATVLGCALAGLAGCLSGLDIGIVPTMGFRALLLAVVACIVGGLASPVGAVLGGVLIGFLQQFAVWTLATEWKDALTFGLLIFVLLVRPQGLLGKKLTRVTV